MQVTDSKGLRLEPGQGDRAVLAGPGQRMTRYWMKAPPQGQREVVITNSGKEPRDFAFQVHSTAPAVTLAAHAENDVVLLSTPMILKAAVATDRPVSGAKVVANVERPDRQVIPVELFDDGDWKHQDERANDGAYSNVFEEYGGAGSYNVEVSVDSEGAMSVCPDEETTELCDPKSVERFVRKVRFSVVAQEVRQGKKEDGRRPAAR